MNDFWLVNSVQGAWWWCQGSGALFFYKMLALVHNFADFCLLGCTSPKLMLRYSSTSTNVVMLKNEG